MNVLVDPDRCCSSGLCVLAVPSVFEQDEDCVVRLADARPPQDTHQRVREAARRCPGRAITVLEDGVSRHTLMEE
ncbi:ferredoxin [Actinoallomurus iriomotensis]|uniref:Ferredoxin n=1 Tax=Actinoallomurus iriomotensis TaxID=478107 RepID=A0A9W6RGF4_9ACTN|nr:ferredoxin [Actinoallomurus iriomotensis]GLY75491.1 hypothetical protein Airi01_037580 [Actinoallomurus iriomotensis]